MAALGMRLLIGVFLFGSGYAWYSCPGLHQLLNGRQFFRYGGIYVAFFCNPGFDWYGYRTSSCVSGRWTRDPPVCVAPGCPDVGSIPHGSRTVHKDNSVVRYTCDPGFRLSGSPMLYCNGSRWNGTKPVCKELDAVRVEEIHTEITKSNSLPNLNAPLSMKTLSGNLFKVQCCNTGDTAAKGSLAEHILPLSEHHTGAITKAFLGQQLLPTEQPVIGEVAPGKNIKGAWNAKAASGNALFNKGSSEDQYNQVNIQPVSSISAHLSLPSLTRPRLSSTLPLHTVWVTPLSSPRTKSSTAFLGPEPHSRMRLISSKTPSPAYPQRSSSLYQPSKPLPQSNLTNLSNRTFPPSSTQRDTAPPPSLNQSSNIFHTSSVRKYPSTPVPGQWTSKSSLLDNQNASSSQSHSITVLERTIYPAPVVLKPYGWLRGTMSGVPEEDGSMGKEDASAARRKQPQKEKIPLNIDSQQVGTLGWFTPAVTANGISSKPSSSLAEGIASPQSDSKSLRGESSQDVTDKYTFTSASETKTAPSPSDTYSRGADQMKEGHPTVGLEGTSLPAWSVTDILLPKTGNAYGNSNLPGPVHGQSSISKTTIAILQHAETLSPQTIRHVSDLNASENTGLGNQSNSTNWPEGLTDKDRSTTEQRLSQLDAFGEINGPKNPQLTTTTRGAQSNVGQTKSNVRGSTAAESTSPSTHSATVRAQGEQITLNGSLSINKSSNLTDFMSNVHDAKPTKLTLQNNRGEMSVVGETDVGQVDLPRPIVCPSPVAPDHGRLYFRNLVRLSPWQHKYYIQYSCTPGYALIRGDRFRFCQHNGSWSGERPVCADVNECVVGQSHCQQICINTFGHYMCACHSGFQLSQDGQSCTDIDECQEVHSREMQCEWRCLNIQGSFRCVCPRGYILSDDRYRCEDINECNYTNGGCAQLCINASGRYQCVCREGYILSPYNGKNCHLIGVQKQP